MLSFAALSRRAIVAAATVLALTPRTEARKKKGRKKKPSPPLASAAIRLSDFVDEGTRFDWRFEGSYAHPARSGAFSGNAFVALGVSADQTRVEILASAWDQVRQILLLSGGPDVPVNRIAVVLL